MSVKTWLVDRLDRGFDVLLPLSYGRPGFALRRGGFVEPAVTLRGRRYLVTGASRGIGRAIAEGLHARGAHVILAVRDVAAGAQVAAAIAADGDRVEVQRVDLASRKAIDALVSVLSDAPLDGIIHNAGAMFDHFAKTEDGFEQTWATHVLGPHELTRGLLRTLEGATDPRVITVSSGGQYGVRLPSPGHVDEPFDGVRQYAYAKRAQLALTRWWSAGGSPIAFYAMHPGWVRTDALASAMPKFYRFTGPVLRTPAQGADTAVWLCAAPRHELTDGGFYFDRRQRAGHLPGRADPEDAADDYGAWCEASLDS